jgi:hypothetical protein
MDKFRGCGPPSEDRNIYKVTNDPKEPEKEVNGRQPLAVGRTSLCALCA